MDVDVRRSKIAKRNRLLDPSQHVIASAALVVAEIVVETDLSDAASLEERDHLGGPACRNPTGRRRATIIKKYLHRSGVLDPRSPRRFLRRAESLVKCSSAPGVVRRFQQ